MYAIAFDMVITDLRANYGEPYNNAYFEINKVLRQYEFYNTQGSVYLTEKTDMANLFRAIDALKRIPWFQASVRDLRAFRVEDWSNFTDFIKENCFHLFNCGKYSFIVFRASSTVYFTSESLLNSSR